MSEVPFTRIPNIIIDKYLPKLPGSEMSVLTVIIRKTIGFNKEKDRIALSTFEKMSGQARSTVIKAIKELIGKQLVVKDISTKPTTYAINYKLMTADSSNKNQVVRKSNPSSIIQLPEVVLSNQHLVRNSNTQKNTLKQKKETTSTLIKVEESINLVIKFWNSLFDEKLDPKITEGFEMVREALERFSKDDLIKAMYFRSKSEYYLEKVFYLRNNPKSFFKHPKTIENDLRRMPSNLYTYSSMYEKVCDTPGLSMDKFSRSDFLLDEDGKAMWELII